MRGLRPLRARPHLLAPALAALVAAAPAHAIPPYARQTGAACNACHTAYPQLTPFGRQFKLGGYTDGDPDTALYEKIGAWLQGSFTHTSKDQPGGAAPDFGANNNFALDQASLFFGGRIVDGIGAFVQGTFDGIGKDWSWDNVDVRLADRGSLAGEDLVYGFTANNNPSVTDPWNTAPAWSFPFDGSGLAPGPSASPLIVDGLGQVVLGATVYADWRSSVYAEAGLYRTLSRGAIDALAVSAAGVPKSDGVAPYWRLAWHRDDAAQSWMVGTFGLHASLFPGGDESGGADSYTDLGLDAQYQHFGERDSVTLRGRLIHEVQDLGGSFVLGGASSATGSLNSFDASASYLYDSTYQVSLGVMHLWGGADGLLYGTATGSPTSTDFVIQFDWLPFNKEPWPVFIGFNPRLTVQFVHYTKFDGQTAGASENDTLFLLATATF